MKLFAMLLALFSSLPCTAIADSGRNLPAPCGLVSYGEAHVLGLEKTELEESSDVTEKGTAARKCAYVHYSEEARSCCRVELFSIHIERTANTRDEMEKRIAANSSLNKHEMSFSYDNSAYCELVSLPILGKSAACIGATKNHLVTIIGKNPKTLKVSIFIAITQRIVARAQRFDDP